MKLRRILVLTSFCVPVVPALAQNDVAAAPRVVEAPPLMTALVVPSSAVANGQRVRESGEVARLTPTFVFTAPTFAESAPVAVPIPAPAAQTPRVAANYSFQASAPSDLAPVTSMVPLPTLKTAEIPEKPQDDREMLARLDADLALASRRLDTARERLSEGQRQLGSFTTVLQKAMLEAGPDAKGLSPFVKVGQRYLGTPYVWGGESGRGFDCSGFIIRVMRDLGYRALPHSAAEQFGYGLPVAQQLLKPGDLVFFANTYKPGISHVGIYLGKRHFIHAAGTGIGTIVSSLDTPKFQAKYAGARRLIPARS